MTSVQSESLWRQIAKDRKAIGIRRLSPAEAAARFVQKMKKPAPKPAL